MSTYTIPELLQKWKLGELTAEQALGYLFQNLVAQEKRHTDTEKRLQRIEQHLNLKP